MSQFLQPINDTKGKTPDPATRYNLFGSCEPNVKTNKQKNKQKTHTF